MNITENNKLIAEFMGVIEKLNNGTETLHTPDGMMINPYHDDEICYEESWDWLMPVVEKIETLGYGVTIGMGTYVVIQDDITDTGLEITKMTDNNKLFCTYEAVIEFIKWYNKNK